MNEVVIELKRKFPWCAKYAEYILFRAQGLKKQAQISLREFFFDFKVQKVKERRIFIDHIHNIALSTGDYSLYLPLNLNNEIFRPEINSWIADEPNDPVPYKWTLDLIYLKKSIELDPSDEVALSLFGKILIGKISMNQHELSSGFGYDGNPKEDIQLINFYEKLLMTSRTSKKIEDLKKVLNGLKKCAEHYLTDNLN